MRGAQVSIMRRVSMMHNDPDDAAARVQFAASQKQAIRSHFAQHRPSMGGEPRSLMLSIRSPMLPPEPEPNVCLSLSSPMQSLPKNLCPSPVLLQNDTEYNKDKTLTPLQCSIEWADDHSLRASLLRSTSRLSFVDLSSNSCILCVYDMQRLNARGNDQTLRGKIYVLMTDQHSSKAAFVFGVCILLTITASAIAFVLESLPELNPVVNK
eukprot:gene876-1849_t